MSQNAFVCWTEHPAPWEVEVEVIASLHPPLNLDGNSQHPFCRTLSALRRDAKEIARQLTGPDVLILSQNRAETYVPSDREVCISITDPHKPVASLSDRFLAVLRVSFSDITEALDHPDYALFDSKHAGEIVRFAKEWRNVDRIVVHCRAGLSRSPGIGIGLTELFSWGTVDDLLKEHSLCNHWVRQELVRVGRELLQSQ
jgi:hypothetical protein